MSQYKLNPLLIALISLVIALLVHYLFFSKLQFSTTVHVFTGILIFYIVFAIIGVNSKKRGK